MIETLCSESIALLKDMIEISSLSRDEEKVAEMIRERLTSFGLSYETEKNNSWIRSKNWIEGGKTVLFNSHIDTVKPSSAWSYDPYKATVVEDKIFGLGSNDAGASVVSQLAAFRYLNDQDRNFNMIWSATAEEEITGPNGVVLVLPHLGEIDIAIVGEPTEMQMAVAEKGLIVVDCYAEGKSGHAAREEGINAIQIAVDDIVKLREYKFDKVSDLLGAVKISTTIIAAGKQHNVVPDSCSFTLDIRTNEFYSNRAVIDTLQEITTSKLKERSLRINSSATPMDHRFVKRGTSLGLTHFGSPTTSDQSVIPFNTIKIGPGHSGRSHTADEYIKDVEIEEAVKIYIDLLKDLY